MRIIAGSARRTILEVPEGKTTRPFLEIARGALMNALAGRLSGMRVLDLYAGSGALGLEALSRGAGRCSFIEKDPDAFAALGRNIARCRLENRSLRVRDSVLAALVRESEPYDLILADPPFAELPEWRTDGRFVEEMRIIAGLLAPGGTLVFRIEDGKVPSPEWPGLELVSDRRYGRSRVCRYEPRHVLGNCHGQ